MKWFVLFFALAIAGCSASGIKTLSVAGEGENITNCDTCLEVVIKNTGKDNISSIVIHTDRSEDYHFSGIEADKTSPPLKMWRLCNCGYTIEAKYYKSQDEQVTLMTNCVNVMPCTDYYKGKLLIELNADKLPKDLNSIEARQKGLSAKFVQK